MSSTLARRTRVMVVVLALAFGVVAVPACKEATQIDIKLSSNVCLPNDTSYSVTVVDPNDERAVASLRPPDANAPIVVDLGNVFRSCETANGYFDLGEATIVPSSENPRVLVQIVLGIEGQSADACREIDKNRRCIFARRRVAFVEHRRIVVPVFLDGLRCAGKDCDAADKTCFAGGCVSAEADRCAGGTCLTPEEEKNGGPIPPDAAKPSDGGFVATDGAQLGMDGAPLVDSSALDADLDVGTGEGGAEASTSMDASDGAVNETCLQGTGLGCAKVPFSGSDAGVAGVCCGSAQGALVTPSCENPFTGGCNMGTQRYTACLDTSDCTNLNAPVCYKPKGKTVGVCGLIVSCVDAGGSGDAGAGAGSACGFVSYCCAPAFDCVRGQNTGGPGYCLTRP